MEITPLLINFELILYFAILHFIVFLIALIAS